MSLLAYSLVLIVSVLSAHAILRINGIAFTDHTKSQSKHSELIAFLGNLLLSDRQLGQLCGPVPMYKFYSELLESMFYYAKRFGVSPWGYLTQLRQAIAKDYQFDSKNKSVEHGCWAQYIIVSVFSWFFLLVLFQQGFSTGGYLWVTIVLQILGAVSHMVFTRTVYRRVYRHFDKVFLIFYQFSLFLEVELSVDDKIHHSQVGELAQLTPLPCEGLSKCIQRLQVVVQRYRKTGVHPRDELSLLIEELWFQYGECFALYHRRLVFARYLHIFLFFLPSFLAIIWGVLSTSIGQL